MTSAINNLDDQISEILQTVTQNVMHVQLDRPIKFIDPVSSEESTVGKRENFFQGALQICTTLNSYASLKSSAF